MSDQARRDDLIGPLIDRLLHDPSIQTGQLTPETGGQLIGMTKVEEPITGLPFSPPSQPLVMSHQTTELRNVETLMIGTLLFG